MAKASIASAYVQVIPTTEGLKQNLVGQMMPQAEKAGDSAGNSAGLNFAKKMVGAIAVAKIGQKITDTIKGAVDIGGALQQSMGGIEALYGTDVAEKMVANANAAFKTVGVSANAYMEQVTGFSAALINSVGGDTEKAAEIANQAMIDMGDNVNRFGTDMESVQNAISGLSRGNYTMLDNLKLGFAGNQQGMIDLINTSGVLEEKITSLDGIGFDTMLQAIHNVQEQIGVAGTTAAEAETTLQGSFSAMSAAWENLQGQMAIGGDISGAIKGMVDTIPTYLGNLLPMIGNVITGLGSSLGPMVMELGGQLLENIKSFDFVGAAQGIVDSIHSAIEGDGFGQFVEMATEIITTLANGIGESLPELIPAILELVLYIGQTLLEHAPELMEAGLNILLGLIEGLINAIPVLIERLPEIINTILNAMEEWALTLMDKAPELISAIANGIGNSLQTLADALPQIIDTITNFITNELETLKEKGREMLNNIKDGIINAAPNIKAGATELLAKLAESVTNAHERIKNWGRNILNNIKNGIIERVQSVVSIGEDIVRGVWQGIQNLAGWIETKARGFADGIVNGIKGALRIGSPSKVMADEIGRWIPPGIAVGIEANAGAVTDAISDIRADALAAFPGITNAITYSGANQPAVAGAGANINVNIYARDGQSVDDLYNVFERRLTQAVLRKGAAYA